MQLTNTWKAAIIGFAVIVGVSSLIWTGIKLDVLALGLNDHIYNIGLVVLTILNSSVLSLLAYLGIKAPTMEDKAEAAPKE